MDTSKITYLPTTRSPCHIPRPTARRHSLSFHFFTEYTSPYTHCPLSRLSKTRLVLSRPASYIVMDMSSSMSSMMVVFTNSQNTPLYSTAWTPSSTGSYAGTCIFLIILASLLRCLLAFKSNVEQRWRANARNRPLVIVKGRNAEAGRPDAESETKTQTLITSRGVVEEVKGNRATSRGPVPFRLSVDLPRAALVLVISGVGYLL